MEQSGIILSVRRIQEYIEAHILEPITLYDLSKAANYSPWHCERIFRELTGETPFDYIRKIRLSKAAMILRDKKPKVIDVAFDFLFDSHEGFTKAFSRQFGISPKHYSVKSPPIRLFIPYPAYDKRHTLQKGEDTMAQNSTNTDYPMIYPCKNR
jgi:AraC-like DNA-binding protein